jgi:Raf kinase inhibitor-like YbhB/YbcL family protein
MRTSDRLQWLVWTALALSVGCGGDETPPQGAAGSPVTSAGVGAGTAGAGAAGTTGTAGTGAAGRGSAGSPAAGSTGATAGTGAAGTGAAGTGTAGAGTAGAGTAGTGAGGTGGGAAGAAGTAAGSGAAGMPAAGGPFTLTSSAVMEGQMIPSEYRGAMADSPELTWTAGPAGTMSYAVTFIDQTDGFAGTVHWVIWDIPASVTTLPKGVPTDAMPAMPMGAKQGQNYSGGTGYTGPGAPFGMNMYRFTVYALPTATLAGAMAGGADTASVEAIEGAMNLGTASLNITSMP